MKVWITRDKGCHIGEKGVYIWRGKVKPKSCGRHGEIDYDVDKGVEICLLSVFQFKALFGFTPRKGSCNLYNWDSNLTKLVLP